MRILTVGLLTGATLLGAGCGDTNQRLEKTQSELTALIQRVASLEVENRGLKERLETIQEAPAAVQAPASTGGVSMAVEQHAADKLTKIIASTIDARIDARLNARIGTDADIQHVFEQAVTQEFAVREERERKAQEERARQMQAEAEKRRAEWQQQQIDRLAQDLALNSQQKELVMAAYRTMNDTQRDLEKKANESDPRPDRQEMQQAHEQVRAQYTASLKQIMTAEQFKAYEERRGQHGMGRRGGGMF